MFYGGRREGSEAGEITILGTEAGEVTDTTSSNISITLVKKSSNIHSKAQQFTKVCFNILFILSFWSSCSLTHMVPDFLIDKPNLKGLFQDP